MSTPKPKNMVKIHVHNREKAKDFICRLFGRWSNESKLIYLIMILSYLYKLFIRTYEYRAVRTENHATLHVLLQNTYD